MVTWFTEECVKTTDEYSFRHALREFAGAVASVSADRSRVTTPVSVAVKHFRDAGRITSCSETDDGRILIILTGVSRFDVEEELDVDTHYRQIIPAWEAYRPDLTEPEDGNIDRERLYASLRVYFETRDFDTDWELLQEATDESLINSLVMSCPFDPPEKQSLLEAHGLDERTRLMSSLLDMAALRRATSELSLH